MSVTSETDPVAAVIDLLEAAAAGDWPSSTPPDRIERGETSEPSEKLRDSRRSHVSMYVYSPVDGDLAKYDPAGDRVDQTEVVQVNVYTADAATANSYVSAAQSILAAYATDNAQQTEWVDVWPSSVTDNSVQAFQLAGGFAVVSLRVRLRRNATV